MTGGVQILLVVGLMLLNWGIEARKWQIVVSINSPVSFNTSFRAVFAGNALAFFTPNRTGEYFGRMLYLESGKRMASIPLTLVCSIAQLIITVVAGGMGLIVMAEKIAVESAVVHSWLSIMLYSTAAIFVFLTILYFRLNYVAKYLSGKRWMLRWTGHLRVLEGVNATLLLYILSLSIARYVVFILQYYLLFRVFGVEVDWWQAFWAVSVVFFVIAIIPTLGFLPELGIRWQAGIGVLQLYSANVAGIFATSLAIWIINLAIPAMAGGLLILSLKIFRK